MIIHDLIVAKDKNGRTRRDDRGNDMAYSGCEEFGSWSEFVTASETCKPGRVNTAEHGTCWPGVFESNRSKLLANWVGVKSVPEAFQIARGGWQDVLDGVKPSDEDLVPAMRRRRRSVWSDQDGELSLERFSEFSDKPFRSTKREIREDRARLTLVACPLPSSYETTKDIAERAKRILRLIMKAEMDGAIVELICVYGMVGCVYGMVGSLQIGPEVHGHLSIVTVKGFGQDLAPHVLTAAFHPSAARVLYPRVWMSTARDKYRFAMDEGNGYPLSAERTTDVIRSLWPDRTCMAIGGTDDAARIEKLISEIKNS